jgi:hypothetical protein
MCLFSSIGKVKAANTRGDPTRDRPANPGQAADRVRAGDWPPVSRNFGPNAAGQTGRLARLNLDS